MLPLVHLKTSPGPREAVLVVNRQLGSQREIEAQKAHDEWFAGLLVGRMIREGKLCRKTRPGGTVAAVLSRKN